MSEKSNSSRIRLSGLSRSVNGGNPFSRHGRSAERSTGRTGSTTGRISEERQVRPVDRSADRSADRPIKEEKSSHDQPKRNKPHRGVFSEKDGSISVFKGDGNESLNISLDDIRNRLHRLYRGADKPINSLHGSDKEDFQILVGYTKTLYDTAPYRMYHDEVKSVFGKLQNIRPGTVGAYFAGCIVKPSFKELKGCSSICAGSMPLPPDASEVDLKSDQAPLGGNQDASEGGMTCSYPVIFANREVSTAAGASPAVASPAIAGKENYQFVLLHNGINKDFIIVYIDGNHPFNGFSKSEKEFLQKHYNAKKINVVRFTDQDSDDEEVFDGFLELSEIPTRKIQGNTGFSLFGTGSSSGNGIGNTSWGSATTGWLLLFFLIIIVVVVIIAVWQSNKRRAASVASPTLAPGSVQVATASAAFSTESTPPALFPSAIPLNQ